MSNQIGRQWHKVSPNKYAFGVKIENGAVEKVIAWIELSSNDYSCNWFIAASKSVEPGVGGVCFTLSEAQQAAESNILNGKEVR